MTLQERLRDSAKAGRAIDRADLLNEAAARIDALEEMQLKSAESFSTALREMLRYASKSGRLEGALTVISWGLLKDPIKVAKDSLRELK